MSDHVVIPSRNSISLLWNSTVGNDKVSVVLLHFSETSYGRNKTLLGKLTWEDSLHLYHSVNNKTPLTLSITKSKPKPNELIPNSEVVTSVDLRTTVLLTKPSTRTPVFQGSLNSSHENRSPIDVKIGLFGDGREKNSKLFLRASGQLRPSVEFWYSLKTDSCFGWTVLRLNSLESLWLDLKTILTRVSGATRIRQCTRSLSRNNIFGQTQPEISWSITAASVIGFTMSQTSKDLFPTLSNVSQVPRMTSFDGQRIRKNYSKCRHLDGDYPIPPWWILVDYLSCDVLPLDSVVSPSFRLDPGP